MQVQQHIYLQDYRRPSVAVSQRKNDHMQVYTIIMECFQMMLIKREFEVSLFNSKLNDCTDKNVQRGPIKLIIARSHISIIS